MSFAARFTPPRREELSDLLRKYDTLADLRQRREDGGGVAPRGELLVLARAFPGALRELDTLPIAVVEERRQALRSAVNGEPPAPWMTWMIAYHATMRAALFLKARLARTRAALADDVARELADDASRRFDLPIDVAFVHAVARPPARRVNAAVFERLGRELGVLPDAMWEALFPSRRAGRF
ncbi:MAG: hypothetical protein ABW133_01930 [Polyangiaceae bacterium]